MNSILSFLSSPSPSHCFWHIFFFSFHFTKRTKAETYVSRTSYRVTTRLSLHKQNDKIKSSLLVLVRFSFFVFLLRILSILCSHIGTPPQMESAKWERRKQKHKQLGETTMRWAASFSSLRPSLLITNVMNNMNNGNNSNSSSGGGNNNRDNSFASLCLVTNHSQSVLRFFLNFDFWCCCHVPMPNTQASRYQSQNTSRNGDDAIVSCEMWCVRNSVRTATSWQPSNGVSVLRRSHRQPIS